MEKVRNEQKAEGIMDILGARTGGTQRHVEQVFNPSVMPFVWGRCEEFHQGVPTDWVLHLERAVV